MFGWPNVIKFLSISILAIYYNRRQKTVSTKKTKLDHYFGIQLMLNSVLAFYKYGNL